MHASQTDNGQHLLMALTRYQRKREGGRLLIRFGCERSERLQRNFHIYIYICIRLKIVERIEDIGLEKYLSFSKGC